MRHLCLVVCCLTACGDDGVRHTPDASPHDGTVADTPPDGPPQPVTLTVTLDGAPRPDIQVWFLNADSSVVKSTTTDATGVATAIMGPGGSVTALDPYALPPPPAAIAGGSHDLYTFMGVKPGDHLVLADTTEMPGISVTVTAPLDPTAGVVSYEAQTPCGANSLASPGSGANPTGQIGLGAGCGAATDFMLITRDEANQVVDYAYIPAQAISDGATIDLSTATWAAGSTRTYSYTNIPTNYALPSFTDSVLTAQGTMLSLYNYGGDTEPVPVATVGIGTHLSDTSIHGSSVGNHRLLDWGPYAATYTLDVGARVLPDLNGFPQLDTTAHTLTIDEQPGGVTPDLMYSYTYAYRQTDDTNWQWQIAAPHATTITMPTLPTDLYDFTIASTDNSDTSGLILAKVPGGYDAVRPYVFARDFPDSAVVGSSGSATIEQVFGKFARTRRGATAAGKATTGFQHRRR